MRWDAHRAAEPEVAKSLHLYADAGVFAAAKALGRSTRSINRIARQFGVEFSATTEDAMRKRRQERASLVAQVRDLAGTRSQMDICAALGITRAILREIAEINFIDIDSRKRVKP